MIAFTVYGVPLPKGSHTARVVRTRKGAAVAVLTDTNPKVRSWQHLVAHGASEALNAAADRTLLDGAVRVSVAFHLPRPQKYGKRGQWIAHTVAPDLDKLVRAILDALTSVIYGDDSQVSELRIGKYYAGVGEPSRVNVWVERAPIRPTVTAAACLDGADPLPLFDGVTP